MKGRSLTTHRTAGFPGQGGDEPQGNYSTRPPLLGRGKSWSLRQVRLDATVSASGPSLVAVHADPPTPARRCPLTPSALCVCAVLDLVYWKDPKVSGLAFFAGLVAFFILGVWEWSSLGLVCLIARCVHPHR